MEYRNYYNTPREMIGDEMLTELLREKEPQSDNYGNYSGGRTVRQTRREIPRNEMGGGNTGGTSGGCGCNNGNTSTCGCRNGVNNTGNGNNTTPNCRGEYPVATVANVRYEWENPRLEGNPLAMVYSPAQEFDDLYEVEKALDRGTLFKKLDLVFYPACCSR